MEREVRNRAPFDLDRADVRAVGDEVAAHHAVEIVAIDQIGLLRGRIERVAVIGHPVEAVEIVVGIDAERVGDRERARDRPAVAARTDIVAARRIGIVIQAVDADRSRIAQFVVRIDRAAIIILGPHAALGDDEVVAELRALGLQADQPASGPAPAEHRAGALDHLDLLDREDLAAGHARIAQAIDIDVVASLEPADEDTVTESIATLARTQRHARRTADDLAEAGRADILDHFLGDDRLRLGRVEHRVGEFTVTRFRLVGRFGLRIHVHVGALAGDNDIGIALLVGVGRNRDERRAERAGEQRGALSAGRGATGGAAGGRA